MRGPSKLARSAAVLFSLSLLTAYVWHSHVTPNTPPPDPLGLNGIELTLEPGDVEFGGFVAYGSPVPAYPVSAQELIRTGSPAPAFRPPQELRIISSKVINQPIFTPQHAPFRWIQDAKKGEREIQFGQFGVEINGRPGLVDGTGTQVPYRHRGSFWQRLFGKNRANHDLQEPPPASGKNASDLRIISSKVINQPVFSVRKISLPWETTRSLWSGRKGDPFNVKPDVRYEEHGINLSAFSRE